MSLFYTPASLVQGRGELESVPAHNICNSMCADQLKQTLDICLKIC